MGPGPAKIQDPGSSPGPLGSEAHGWGFFERWPHSD